MRLGRRLPGAGLCGCGSGSSAVKRWTSCFRVSRASIEEIEIPGHPGVHLSGRIVHRGDAALVSLFLVNDQEPVKMAKDTAWMFQAEFTVSAEDNPVFLGRNRMLDGHQVTGSELERAELNQLEMMYRRHVEFAAGHGTGVHWETHPGDPTRAWEISTRSVPRYEVPLTEPPRPGEDGFDGLAETVLDMQVLSQLRMMSCPGCWSRWSPGTGRGWGDRLMRIETDPDLGPHAEAAEIAVDQAGRIADRLAASIQLLRDDPVARDAFRFANHTMWQQRVRTIGATLVRQGVSPAHRPSAG